MESSRTRIWLRRTSIAMLWIIPVIVLIAAAILLVYWGFGINNIGDNTLVLFDTPPRPGARLLGFAVALPSLLAWLYALYRLRRMFLRFSHELFVDRAAALDLRAFSLFTIIAVIFDIVTSGARRWAQGLFDNAPLWTHININAAHLSHIFTAVIFLIVSFVLLEAERYKTETEQYF